MPFLTLIVTLAIVGFALWVVVTYIPMPDPFKRVLMAVVILAVLLWLGRALGAF